MWILRRWWCEVWRGKSSLRASFNPKGRVGDGRGELGFAEENPFMEKGLGVEEPGHYMGGAG